MRVQGAIIFSAADIAEYIGSVGSRRGNRTGSNRKNAAGQYAAEKSTQPAIVPDKLHLSP